jgi:formylglycine-generating enzyme required for sulfatase activity
MSLFSPPDYELTQLLGETSAVKLWLAEQVSVRRKVIIEQLIDESPQMRDGFFAMIRAKATMDHPLVASVIEAVNDDNHCFYAYEWLAGRTLEQIIASGDTMPPTRVAHLLKRIAEAQLHIENRATATTPLSLRDIFLDEQNVMRLSNLATSGTRVDPTSIEDLRALGQALPPLIQQGASGASRVSTLLNWMKGENSEQIVSWKDVRHYADQIEQQLASAVAASATPIVSTKKKPTPPPSLAPWIIAGVVAIAAIVVVVLMQAPKPEIIEAKKASLPIEIPSSSYMGNDGKEVQMRQFWLGAHEVTIQEYKDFLESMEQLTAQQRKVFAHENQPATKNNYLPEDWDNIISAAAKKSTWKNRQLSFQSPVFNIDWWDAYTYCEWKRGRLPTQEEWGAALRLGGTDPAALKVLTWTDVTGEDETPAGFTGMAGGVKEWTRRPVSNPTNPLGTPKWVLCGASSFTPKGGALNCTYLDDRSTRSDEIGFRVAYDHKPDE